MLIRTTPKSNLFQGKKNDPMWNLDGNNWFFYLERNEYFLVHEFFW